MSATEVNWIQVTVRVDADTADTAEDMLFELGAASVTLLDAADHPVHEPDPGETPLWPIVLVRGLFEPELDRAEISERLHAAGLVRSANQVDFDKLADQDWERAWMDRFRPMQFGRDLWICPSHREPDPDWPIVIRLDPGLAFGSGTHPTTALCLEWIDGQNFDGKRVIDYGCGSGILAIACALKGASRVIAIDHDPQALTATLENARRNGVESKISALLPDTPEAAAAMANQADVVVANILAAPLIELAPMLLNSLQPGGALVLSGILHEQCESVVRAYTDLGQAADIRRKDEWVRLVFLRNSGRG